MGSGAGVGQSVHPSVKIEDSLDVTLQEMLVLGLFVPVRIILAFLFGVFYQNHVIACHEGVDLVSTRPFILSVLLVNICH